MAEKTPYYAMPEAEFREQVLDLARYLGWRCYHTWASLHSPAGFPDLVLVRLSRLAFMEVKSEKGKLTKAQEDWLKDLEFTGKCEVFMFRPSDWEKIVEVLS